MKHTYLSIHDICNNEMQDNLNEIETTFKKVLNRDFSDYIEAVGMIEETQRLCRDGIEYIEVGFTHDDDNILTDIYKSYIETLEAYKSMLYLMNSGA